MHELSLARGVVELVEEHVPAERRADVRAVRLRAGALAGVVADSLQFCFEAVVAGTPLAAAHLEIESPPLRLGCGVCGARSELETLRLCCPACGSTAVEVLSGSELDVTEVELEERAAEAS